MATRQSDITVYGNQTPNSIKVTMLLEELGLPYKYTVVDQLKNEHKAPWFAELNPNSRIPVLTDTLADGSAVRVFESNAILQYLVDRYDTTHKISYAPGTPEHYEVYAWLSWQVSAMGPMAAQAVHFIYFTPENQYGVDRYIGEVRRAFTVLDTHLSKSASGYIVGDHLSIADLACWPWTAGIAWTRLSRDEFPHVKAWFEKVLQHPSVEKGRHVPTRHTMMEPGSIEAFSKFVASVKAKSAEKASTEAT